MARRGGLLQALARDAARRRAAQQRGSTKTAQNAERAATKASQDAERARRAYEREASRAAALEAKEQRAQEREAARLYAEARAAEVVHLNAQLGDEVELLGHLLEATLDVDDYLDLETLKQPPVLPVFDPGALETPPREPRLEQYLPAPPGFLARLRPGAKAQYESDLAAGHKRYAAAHAHYESQEAARQDALARARAAHERAVTDARAETAAQHAEVDLLRRELAERSADAVATYCMLVLEASSYPASFPRSAKVAYVPESRQLVVELTLPSIEVVPTVEAHRYVKAKDEIAATPRPQTQRRAIYASVVAQITLRTLHELFEADRTGSIETIVLNGYVDAIDPGTGRPVRPCLVTVRAGRETFDQLDLRRVDPVACLRTLRAEFSRSPAELAPVRPVLEFDMVDPRFVQETDVLSTLDQRPNLMELSPGEFESLITNLFQKMGLETRLTQASRDGGVDCVAYDPRPIFGGKVVIQAKRYKHTVGVSAVRDLFGTVQSEGASKGILVTTSGYGTAAFDFATGKPLELLSGSHLLHLLAEHADIQARIDVPASWRDPMPDQDND